MSILGPRALSSTELELYITGRPAPKYGDRPHSYTAVGARAWHEAIGYALKLEANRQGWVMAVGEPVRVDVVFFMPRRGRGLSWPAMTPDVDKLLRLVLDAATGIVWGDDAQVVQGSFEERWADAVFPVGMAVRFSRVLDEQLPRWCTPALPRPIDEDETLGRPRPALERRRRRAVAPVVLRDSVAHAPERRHDGV